MVQDGGKELHGLKAVAVLMIVGIFATTVSSSGREATTC